MSYETLAKLAFEAYAKEYRSPAGWEDIGPECQAAWKAAVTAVIHRSAEEWAAHHAGYQAEAAAERAAAREIHSAAFFLRGSYSCPQCALQLEEAGFPYGSILVHPSRRGCVNSGTKFKRPTVALEEIR